MFMNRKYTEEGMFTFKLAHELRITLQEGRLVSMVKVSHYSINTSAGNVWLVDAIN